MVTATALIAPLAITPVAHADDPLAPIRLAVTDTRAASGCPALNYRADLEESAQGYARFGLTRNGYPGAKHGIKATGDPEAEAIDHAIERGTASIQDCGYTDFGVGFVRYDETDTVAVVLGRLT